VDDDGALVLEYALAKSRQLLARRPMTNRKKEKGEVNNYGYFSGAN
jgi:hypothetical protein